MKNNIPQVLETIAHDDELLEIGRLAIEDELVEWRDSRRSMLRNNGFVIKERDGKESHIIRFGAEQGINIALRAIAKHMRKNQK